MLEGAPMIETKKITLIALITGLSFNILCNVIYDIVQIPNVWYIGNSFAFVCYAYVLNELLKSKVTIIILALAISQFLDEIFGSPQSFEPIEYVSAVVLIAYFLYKK